MLDDRHFRECPACGRETFTFERCHECGDIPWKGTSEMFCDEASQRRTNAVNNQC